jgi:MOSC domain-containing protein YiiM
MTTIPTTQTPKTHHRIMQNHLLVFAVVGGLCNAAGSNCWYQQHQEQRGITTAFAATTVSFRSRTSIHTRSDGHYPRRQVRLPVDSQKIVYTCLAPNNSKVRTNNMMAASSDGQDMSSTPVVVRLAAKPFDPSNSKPSSRNYTTRKVEVSEISVTVEGCQGDYNHYRTLAMKSTKDRAVSLLSEDVLKALRSEYAQYNIQDGDLGENVYVAGVAFHFFRIGERYEFLSPDDDGSDCATTSQRKASVILEITEQMTPCANLCKLPYINQDSLDPKERISRCREFLAFLDRYDGYRGWYAKVVQEGFIHKGSIVRHISS